MTVGALLASTTSAELSGYLALFHIHGEEQEQERHKRESGDGRVIVSGLEHGGDEDEDENDGETE